MGYYQEILIRLQPYNHPLEACLVVELYETNLFFPILNII